MTTPLRELPARPDLEQYRKQARELLDAAHAGQAEAVERVKTTLPGKTPGQLTLTDAQFVLAREHGFENWAAFKSHVELLRPEKADPVEAFKQAVTRGDAAALRRLFKQHPELRRQVNAPLFSFGGRALIQARENRDVVDVLLEHGADLNLKSDWAPGPWGVLDNTKPDMAEYLISRGAVVDVFAAAALGKIDRLRELLDADPSLVHAKGGDGCRPLHFARGAAVMDLLLERGAEIEARDVDHAGTALQWSVPHPPGAGERSFVQRGLDVCRLLVERGAELDVFAAAALGDVDRLRAVLDADPSALAARIGEPSYAPCPRGEAEHIYVYTLGARKTPHQIANEFGNDACVALLSERATPAQRFLMACVNADEPAARALLREHPGLMKDLGPDDARAVADCAGRGQADAVRLMLDLGFPMDVTGMDNGTPLHIAAWFGQLSVVELLLGRGARVDVTDASHQSTPLGWCCHGSRHCARQGADYAAVARALLSAGAKPGPNLNDATPEVRAVLERAGR